MQAAAFGSRAASGTAISILRSVGPFSTDSRIRNPAAGARAGRADEL